jgi:hypothetical protein
MKVHHNFAFQEGALGEPGQCALQFEVEAVGAFGLELAAVTTVLTDPLVTETAMHQDASAQHRGHGYNRP